MKSFRTSRFFVFGVISFLGFVLSVPAWAQKDTGSIVGTVKDGSGAVVVACGIGRLGLVPDRPIRSA